MRSLKARLLIVLLFLTGAAIASAGVMLALYEQSTSARIGEASSLAARSCGAIAQAFRFYTSGWNSTVDLADPRFRTQLTNVVFTALRDRSDIEGGLWQPDVGAFAYAFPTYEGSGPKTDVPQAELPRIESASRAAQTDDRLQTVRFDARSQTLLIAACPLAGPVIGLSAWTMTRVHSIGSVMYWQLLGGLTVLLVSVAGAWLVVAALLARWSGHVGRIEVALAGSAGDLPILGLTGERELDRLVTTLNEAGQRLRSARIEAERLSKAVSDSDRLAAVGRVAAGVAHEIRSPIAAMRLKAEMALDRTTDRKDQALRVVIEQVDRLNGLVARLLAVCERQPLRREIVDVPAFLAACAIPFGAEARARGTCIAVAAAPLLAGLDPAQMERALGCLLANALEAGGSGPVGLEASTDGGRLILTVIDNGPGPPDAVSERLFDPFVTGRPEGAGLGLAIVREVAEAHDGKADFHRLDGTTVFRIGIPWLRS